VAPPTPTPTTAPACGSADLNATPSDASANFNGDPSPLLADKVLGAMEQQMGAEPFITYNVGIVTVSCASPRNLNISIFGSPAPLAGGESFSLVNGSSPAAIVYYGEEGAVHGVWSSTAGTLFIDAVEGDTLTVRIVGAAMGNPAGAATGSFTLDAQGTIGNFTRQ
jgi:hypothetical protein